MNRYLYWLFQLTWGLPQTVLGLILFLINIRKKHYFFKGAVATEWHRSSGISLGLFIFVPGESDKYTKEKLLYHEYGHTIQSIILGPLYLMVIGIPSLVWFNVFKYKNLKFYTKFYTEAWAESIGNKQKNLFKNVKKL